MSTKWIPSFSGDAARCARNLSSANAVRGGGLERGASRSPYPSSRDSQPVRRAMATFLRRVFAAWRMRTLMTLVQVLKSENQSLTERLGKQKSSIWSMRKEDLIEVARKELGMNRWDAEKETVITLREKIRRNRSQIQEESDPLVTLPRGLERMTSAQLCSECQLRGLDISPLPGNRGSVKTRPQMILMIREGVELKNSSSGSQTQTNRAARPKPKPSSAPTRCVVPDWTMEDSPRL